MAALDPTAIVAAPSVPPFTLIPIIKDLVRTRYPVPGSIFLVEDVQIVSLTATGRWQVIRLLLGDGEFCIQAILGDTMHRFVHTGEVAVGTYVRVDDFQLRTNDSLDEHGSSNKIVFLVVHDLSTVGWNRSVQELHEHQRQQHEQQQQKEEIQQYQSALSKNPTVPEIEQKPAREVESPFRSESNTPTKAHRSRSIKPGGKRTPQNSRTADAFEEFEVLAFPLRKSPSKPPATKASDKQSTVPIALARDWHDIQTPLKLTTLRSIPTLPYRQNWSCNVLAIITYLSPVEASHLPPYKQRTARVADPSTAKHVHLTVFLHPEEFSPTVGSAVLLTGVKNHRYDGGSLKKYAGDTVPEKWWIEDPWELKWCDVKGIKAWWADMEAYLATQTSEELEP
ncbi:hypothetical protein E4U13_000862 [Claviceps humidiphila]|uniref:Cyclin-like F-box n=1 Tax=Claviceps humidiphila TaxID=1294629 RepID=A0A9P7TY09_9HYPO|nr:hypothetical protein E4U13_000862 [Claviceps humidiphila]